MQGGYQMEFRRDGTVRSSGSGGPDPYTQQLMSTLFGMLQKKGEENQTQEEKQNNPKKENDMPSDSQGDQEENPVELCFFGLNDFTEPTEPATSSGNVPAQSPDALPKASTKKNKKGKGAKKSKK